MHFRLFILIVAMFGVGLVQASGATLNLPPRPAAALSGSQLAGNSTFLSTNLLERETFVAEQILAGNVPDFLRQLCPIPLNDSEVGGTNYATIYVTPNYLALGSDNDFVLTPITPGTAQRIADATGCMLPTRKIVDEIYRIAEVKLPPQPLTPDSRMTTVPVFLEHNAIICTQLLAAGKPATALSAGSKKDVVITPKLDTAHNKVAIYGWHRTNGTPIQPLYLGHTAAWVDYSHGIRLVAKSMLLNGQPTNVAGVLHDPQLGGLLSNEGILTGPRYPTNFPAPRRVDSGDQLWPHNFVPNHHYGELTRELNLPDGVRVSVNTPPIQSFATNKPMELIFFALPNGNTIEWTAGKRLQPGDDWHYDIQHIAAQTRFLRNVITNRTVVVAYLENSLRSWPAWRRKHGNEAIPTILQTVRDLFKAYPQEIVLTGHSGAGSLTFGYLNAISEIPANVKRIAFLDSNYAYETTNHFAKLVSWLKRSDENTLCVLAYHDSIALLNGKTFVSERGGTWGRSHAMLEDLRKEFSFDGVTNNVGLQTHIAANGRLQFYLKENPEKKILHTVQVERNGFIHAMLVGTPWVNRGYEYFGERAYETWITPD